MEEKLKNYINQIRKQGLSDEQIKKNLKEQGNWSDKDIDVFFNKNKKPLYNYKRFLSYIIPNYSNIRYVIIVGLCLFLFDFHRLLIKIFEFFGFVNKFGNFDNDGLLVFFFLLFSYFLAAIIEGIISFYYKDKIINIPKEVYYNKMFKFNYVFKHTYKSSLIFSLLVLFLLSFILASFSRPSSIFAIIPIIFSLGLVILSFIYFFILYFFILSKNKFLRIFILILFSTLIPVFILLVKAGSGGMSIGAALSFSFLILVNFCFLITVMYAPYKLLLKIDKNNILK